MSTAAEPLDAAIGERLDPECRAFDAHIAALGTPAVSPEDDARVRAHLERCARCSDLAQLFANSAILSAAPSDEDAPSNGDLSAELVEGALIAGRYRLDHLLGGGGMGVVWAATHTTTRQPVAIKFLRGGGMRARKRLVREARAACAVRHPNVVRVFDVLELADGSPALVMERLEGQSLQRVFDGGPVPLGRLCDILGPIAAALGAAHAAGVVHRDLKPENVFLTPDATSPVRLLDFGIAKHRPLDQGLASGTLTSTGAIVGTPFYMSPEQALGEDDVDARADLWALGLLLYQGLSGVLPTRGENLGQVIKAIAITPFEPLARLVPEAPDDIAALAGRLLAKARESRPALTEVSAVLARHGDSTRDAAPKRRWSPRVRAALVAVGVLSALGATAAFPAARRAVLARRSAGPVVGAALPATGASAAGAATSCPPGTVRVEGGRLQPEFCLDRTEVTVGAYRACVERGACTPSSKKEVAVARERSLGPHLQCNEGVPGREDHPINCVTWQQSDAYCRAVGERLPTADEWRWAARGGAAGRGYAWGDTLPREDQICWRTEETCRVGGKPGGATPTGIMDLAGNVWERTSTLGPNPNSHVACGGGIYEKDPGDVTVARSATSSDGEQLQDVGFRCATFPVMAAESPRGDPGASACAAYYTAFSGHGSACNACLDAQFPTCVPLQSSAHGCTRDNLGTCEQSCGNSDMADNAAHCGCIEACLGACAGVTKRYFACEMTACAASCP